eukprot:m.94455 g.94455  ORF g.94455 m.94455 type:complete len:118 (+) comp8713_c0_seq5:472-825(+)
MRTTAFLSHSLSIQCLKYLFQTALAGLPRCSKIVDVGSRLGAVLYGAYFLTDASEIVGVEISRYFCDLQQKVLDKHHMHDRIRVICDDIFNCTDEMISGDLLLVLYLTAYRLKSSHT